MTSEDVTLTELCRCAALRRAFGPEAALCGSCAWSARRERWLGDGFVSTVPGRMQAYRDVGVEVRTASADGVHHVWVPAWAETIVQLLISPLSKVLSPLLCRCAVDPDFREACISVLALAGPANRDKALEAFADAEGVVCLRPYGD